MTKQEIAMTYQAYYVLPEELLKQIPQLEAASVTVALPPATRHLLLSPTL